MNVNQEIERLKAALQGARDTLRVLAEDLCGKGECECLVATEIKRIDEVLRGEK